MKKGCTISFHGAYLVLPLRLYQVGLGLTSFSRVLLGFTEFFFRFSAPGTWPIAFQDQRRAPATFGRFRYVPLIWPTRSLCFASCVMNTNQSIIDVESIRCTWSLASAVESRLAGDTRLVNLRPITAFGPAGISFAYRRICIRAPANYPVKPASVDHAGP